MNFINLNRFSKIQSSVVRPFTIMEENTGDMNKNVSKFDYEDYLNSPEENPSYYNMVSEDSNSRFELYKGDNFEKDTIGSKQSVCSGLITVAEKEKEKCEALHKNMMEEANRIRQWKLEKEVEMQGKEKQLQFANITISSLRKAILEAQLNNEKISQKVTNDGRLCHEINENMEKTKDLMDSLQIQCQAVESQIGNVRKLKDLFETINNRRISEIEEVCKKLDFCYRQNEDKLNKLNSRHQFEKSELESHLNAQLKRAEDHFEKLHGALDEKKRNEENLMTERLMLKNTIESLMAEKKNYESELRELKVKESDSFMKIDTLEKTLNSLKTSKFDLESMLDEEKKLVREKEDEMKLSKEIITSLQNKIYNEGNSFIKERENLQIDVDKEKLRCEMLSKELKESKENWQSVIEQLESTQKMLDGANEFVNNLKEKRTELEQRINQLELKLREKDEEMEKFQEDFRKMENDFKNVISSLTQTIETLNNNNDVLQNKLDKVEKEFYCKDIQLKTLDVELCKMRNENGKLKMEVENIKSVQNDLEDKFVALTENCDQLSQEKKLLQDENVAIKLEISDCESTIYTLKKENADFQEKLDVLSQENVSLKEEIAELEERVTENGETIEALQIQLDAADSNYKNNTNKGKMTVASLEAKIKSMKLELQTKNKNIKDLEKEVKTEKDMMINHMKQTDTLNDTLKEKNSLLRKKEEECEKLASEARLNRHKLEEAIFKGKSSVREKEANKQLYDTQMKDMMNLMEKTQKDFQKNIVQKENELQECRIQVVDIKRIRRQEELKDSEMKKIKKEKEEIEQDNKILKTKQTDQERKIAQLEEEIKKLNNKLDEQKAANQKQVADKSWIDSTNAITKQDEYDFSLESSDSSAAMNVDEFIRLQELNKKNKEPANNKRKLPISITSAVVKKPLVSSTPLKSNVKVYPSKVLTQKSNTKQRRFFANDKKLGEDYPDNSSWFDKA